MIARLSRTTGTQRIACAALGGLAVAGIARAVGLAGMPAGLLGWCAGVAVYLGLGWWLAHHVDAGQLRHRARTQDPPGLLILVTMLAAIAISLVAIAVMLQQGQQLTGLARAGHVVLGMAALAGSWLTIHTVYAFHYAHAYYQNDDTPDEGGLQFPGSEPPDYADFIYYAYVIGMCAQVSDVQTTSRAMRRLTLVHSVLSFGFNMLVLALSINVVAGAI